MYMCICGHAYFWDEQKGEERRTPGCRLAVGRLRVLKPFLSAQPSSAPPQPSLHPPPPRCCCCTKITDTRTLRSATLGSTLPRWPHLQRVDGFARASTILLCAHPNPITPAALCCPSACAPAAGTEGKFGHLAHDAAAIAVPVARTAGHLGHNASVIE